LEPLRAVGPEHRVGAGGRVVGVQDRGHAGLFFGDEPTGVVEDAFGRQGLGLTGANDFLEHPAQGVITVGDVEVAEGADTFLGGLGDAPGGVVLGFENHTGFVGGAGLEHAVVGGGGGRAVGGAGAGQLADVVVRVVLIGD